MTDARPDLYAVLGVSPTASQAEISHAYRMLLRRHHPDTRVPPDEPQNALSDTTLQQVLAAYAVLRDPARRAEYDRDAKTRIHPSRRPPRLATYQHGTYAEPPIVVGPVRWHRSP